ncbi:NADH-quinone oxidoreductase subunit NuoE [Histomonas meleagridis]|uniref:NADH-quinone oxidoreductase subunit NuoE n=1 Tax=Histomonas meleagridis TaxID=135588 RepID=UPI003559E1BE|nr:NADH-quinone oxidoreductase subunit NuoE [Histomonas meleagridis]KAH0806592.1 NADH-quinone oxidoreductase subunit NuoE [Histomonas meleagridis]
MLSQGCSFFSRVTRKATLLDGKFSFKDMGKVKAIFALYPTDKKKSAIIPLLHLAQEENGGYLNRGALEEVAKLTETSLGRVHETASFYSMFRFSKARKHLVERCNGLSCYVNRSDAIKKAIETACNGTFKEGGSKDGMFDLTEVECLGACANAPTMIVDGVYYQNLTPESIAKIFDIIKKGGNPLPLSAIHAKPNKPLKHE